jgi:hypothetical protein
MTCGSVLCTVDERSGTNCTASGEVGEGMADEDGWTATGVQTYEAEGKEEAAKDA